MIIVNGCTITNKIPTEEQAAEIEKWVKIVYSHEKFLVNIKSIIGKELVIFVDNKEKPHFRYHVRADQSIWFHINQDSDSENISSTINDKVLSIIGETK